MEIGLSMTIAPNRLTQKSRGEPA